MNLNIYEAHFTPIQYQSISGHSSYFGETCIVFAETKIVALALVLEKYPSTYGEGWSFEEVEKPEKAQVMDF